MSDTFPMKRLIFLLPLICVTACQDSSGSDETARLAPTSDEDNDGIINEDDAFPYDPTEWLDTDGDGIGNNADLDDDNDNVIDSEDAFPLDSTESSDTDNDGIGNNADLDDDNDNIVDSEDAFPLDSTEWIDTDGDGIGNNADLDDDNDNVIDSEDAFPLDSTESADTDNDGIGNNADNDDDNDNIADSEDAFPQDSTEWLDTDGDGIGNNADSDDDGDGIADSEDTHPLDPGDIIDSDNDGINDAQERAQGSDPTVSNLIDYSYQFSEDFSEILASDNSAVDDTIWSQVTPKASGYAQFSWASYSGAPVYDDDNGESIFGDMQLNFLLSGQYCPSYALTTTYSRSSAHYTRSMAITRTEDDLVIQESIDIGDITALTSQTYLIERFDSSAETLAISGYRFLVNKLEISASCQLYDSDLDGLSDIHEAAIGTLPFNTDSDNDGLSDAIEVATGRDPLDPSDGADVDSDGDGVVNGEDAFMDDPTEWLDTDGDGIGNNADLDDDNDSVLDGDDALPLDPSEYLDTDGDGIGNNADNDDDGDGVEDSLDTFPLDGTESVDSDGDGIGNNADNDDDDDGIEDARDLYPLVPDDLSVDSDSDGVSDEQELSQGSDPNISNLIDYNVQLTENFTEILASDSSVVDDSIWAQVSTKTSMNASLSWADYMGSPYYDADNGESIFGDMQLNFQLDNLYCADYALDVTYSPSSSHYTRSLSVQRLQDDLIIQAPLDISELTGLTTQRYAVHTLPGGAETIAVIGTRMLLNKLVISAACQLYDGDLDGLSDAQELLIGTDPYDVDSDDDGLDDQREVSHGWNPLDASDGADVDSDGDGVVNGDDPFMDDPTEWLDTDGDGIGNNTDNDDDNDGVLDIYDDLPLDASEQLDTDGDGIGNNADNDDDNDGIADKDDDLPLDPNNDGLTLLERAITSGDVANLSKAELYSALDDELIATRARNSAIKSRLYGIDSIYSDKLSDITWNPTHDSIWQASTDVSVNTPILISNYAAKKTTSSNTTLATFGQTATAPYAVFSANPFVNGNDGMDQLVLNTMAELTGMASIKSESLNIVVSHLPDRYYFPYEDAAYLWLAEKLPNASFNEADSCENANLANCLADADLLIIGQNADESGQTEEQPEQVVAAVKAAQLNGLPVFYVHHDGGKTAQGSALLDYFNISTADNYWSQESADELSVDDLMLPSNSDELATYENVIDTLTNQRLSYADYSGCMGKSSISAGQLFTYYGNCNGQTYATTFKDLLMDDLNSIYTTFYNYDTNVVNIFESDAVNNRVLKLFALLGDRLRFGGPVDAAIDYPIDAENAQNIAEALTSDATTYNVRPIAPRHLDLGNVACTQEEMSNGICQPYDVDSIERHDGVVQKTLPKVPSALSEFTATGFYALPGKPITITRSDNTDTEIGVRVNVDRSKTTRAAIGQFSYLRPERIATPIMWLPDGESLTFTSAIGGPIYLQYNNNAELEGQTVAFTISNVGKHPTVLDSTDQEQVATFAQTVVSNPLPFVDIVNSNFEAHARKSEFIDGANREPYNGDYEALFNAYVNILVDPIYTLAGFKIDGSSLAQSISEEVQTVCTSFDWDCMNEDIHVRTRVQHISFNEYSQCGYGCAGNPFDISGAMVPHGWVEGHELGHNLQVSALKINYVEESARDDWSQYANRSTETSNHIFPYFAKWKRIRLLDDDSSEYAMERHDDKLLFAVAQSQHADLQQEIDGETRKVLFNASCTLLADYPLTTDEPGYEYLYAGNEYSERNSERNTFYSQIGQLADKATMADGTVLENGFEVYTLMYMQQRLFSIAAKSESTWLASREKLGFADFPYSGDAVYGGLTVANIPGNDYMLVALAKITGNDWRPYFDLRLVKYSSLASMAVEHLLGEAPATTGTTWIGGWGSKIPMSNMSEQIPGYLEWFEITSPDTVWPSDDFHPSDCL